MCVAAAPAMWPSGASRPLTRVACAHQVICRPCVAKLEGRKAEPSPADLQKEADWRCAPCAQYAAEFAVCSFLERLTTARDLRTRFPLDRSA